MSDEKKNSFIFLDNKNYQSLIYSVIIGLLGTFSFFGRAITSDNVNHIDIFSVIIIAVLFIGISFGLLSLFQSNTFIHIGEKKAGRLFDYSWKNWLIITGIIFICWIPIVILMLPFSIGPDTVAQLLWSQGYIPWDPSSRQSLDGYIASDHHPFLLTLFYGMFYSLGDFVLGDGTIGLTVLCFIQVVTMCMVFAFLLIWMKKRLVPIILCYASLIFIAFCPIYPMEMFQIVKDITSMPIFILWVICFIEICVCTRNNIKINKAFLVIFIITAVLSCLTRKPLLYIELISSSVLLIIVAITRYKDKMKIKNIEKYEKDNNSIILSIVISIALPLLLTSILLPITYSIIKVAPAGVQEVLAIPIQQVSAVVVEKKSELTEEQLEVIRKVLPINNIFSLYDETTADSVKDKWIRTADDQAVNDFIGLWISLGFQYPDIYKKAISFQDDYWLTGTYANDIPVIWWGWVDRGAKELFPAYEPLTSTEGQDFLNTVLHEIWDHGRSPIGIFLDLATYCFMIPIFSVASILLIRRKNFVLFIPILLSILILFFVPAAQPRYALSLIFCAPLIVSLAFIRLNKRKKLKTQLVEDNK